MNMPKNYSEIFTERAAKYEKLTRELQTNYETLASKSEKDLTEKKENSLEKYTNLIENYRELSKLFATKISDVVKGAKDIITESEEKLNSVRELEKEIHGKFDMNAELSRLAVWCENINKMPTGETLSDILNTEKVSEKILAYNTAFDAETSRSDEILKKNSTKEETDALFDYTNPISYMEFSKIANQRHNLERRVAKLSEKLSKKQTELGTDKVGERTEPGTDKVRERTAKISKAKDELDKLRPNKHYQSEDILQNLAISKSPTTEEIIVYKGLSRWDRLIKMVYNRELLKKILATANEGQTIKVKTSGLYKDKFDKDINERLYNAFIKHQEDMKKSTLKTVELTSTSLERSQAKRFASSHSNTGVPGIILKITLPAGSSTLPILQHSDMSSENEILLPKGKTLSVENIKSKAAGNVVICCTMEK